MPNPFFFGPPVSSDQFAGRRWEVNHIANRIANQGQSTAVVGEPRMGKTSLLLYLASPEARAELYGEVAECLVFSYLDCQTLDIEYSQQEFWKRALRPLRDRAVSADPDSSLAQAYEKCQGVDFDVLNLEHLLEQMRLLDLRLVILLDEFDTLLHHPTLNRPDFFGSLRSLASLSRGALALVIASRLSPDKLNEATRQFSRTGSPYFNFLSETILGPLLDEEVEWLLDRAGAQFTDNDRRLVVDVAGGHPYLLQVVASALWEAIETGHDSYDGWKQAGSRLHAEAGQTISETWRLWSPQMRRALMAVALDQMAAEGDRVHRRRLLRDLRDLGEELRLLQQQGLVTKDASTPSGWRVRPQAFVWWLADELVRTVRHQVPFEDWLRDQVWKGPLTQSEERQWGQAVRVIADLVKDGAATFIEAAAKGTGAGLAA